MADPPLIDELRQVGFAAGLDALGVAAVEPFEATRRTLEERRAAGLHGGMAFTYRNPERSTEPARLLRNARALVVGARSYAREEPSCPPADRPAGRAARYAWQDHYGQLRAGLDAVKGTLRAGGFRAAVFVDQNALVDREAAYRAGLGWYGKNTNLLLPGRGSWFVLGALVTDAPLPAEVAPVADGCGACQRCLDACPTGAFAGPGVLDARRCLAWLLQAPGAFPRELRVAAGDRLYGCDSCQEACPQNRQADGTAVGLGEDHDAWAPLLEVLTASDSELLDRWGRWYLYDREPRYLRRNALIALGNSAAPNDAAVRAAVVAAAVHADPLLRAHAVWAAGRLGYRDVVARAAVDPDATVRAEATAGDVVARTA